VTRLLWGGDAGGLGESPPTEIRDTISRGVCASDRALGHCRWGRLAYREFRGMTRILSRSPSERPFAAYGRRL